MKIELFTPPGVEPTVQNASVLKVKVGLSVVVNTHKRWQHVLWTSGGSGPTIDYNTTEFCIGDPEKLEGTTVVLRPESKKELALLGGVTYTLRNKDQIEFLIIPINKLTDQTLLASTGAL